MKQDSYQKGVSMVSGTPPNKWSPSDQENLDAVLLCSVI